MGAFRVGLNMLNAVQVIFPWIYDIRTDNDMM